MKITKFEFEDMTKAWEGIQNYLLNEEEKIKERGGSVYGSMMVSYDNIIHINNAVLDPKFNFGRVLGYKTKKWSKLINNYVNLNYLDLIKHEVIDRELKRSHSYNYTYHFDNVHGSGKDCLISMSFIRRKHYPKPLIIFYSRASEVTKRLPFDFLLVQRIAEYIYGEGKEIELQCYLPFIFLNLECSLMYVSDRGVKNVVIKKNGRYSKYQDRLLKRLKYFEEVDTEKIKYKVHQRAARQVQRDEKGNPIAACPDLFAKDMKLIKDSDRVTFNSKEGNGKRVKVMANSEEAPLMLKRLRRLIRKRKPTPKDATDLSVALMSGNDFFWKKDWPIEIFKTLSHKRNNDFTIKASGILLNYANKN